MRKKFCPKCNLTSFSAYREVWICPYCSQDMSQQPDLNINDHLEIERVRKEADDQKVAYRHSFTM